MTTLTSGGNARTVTAAICFSLCLLTGSNAQDQNRPTPPTPEAKAFVEAAKQGDLEAVNAALKKGMDVNVKIAGKRTALYAAVERSEVAMVKRLIEAGADVNAKEYLGVTPLHWAAIRGPRESVKALIDAGADVNVYCVQHDTPLGSAAGAGNVEAAEELIKAGADVNGGQSLTPLALAARRNQVPMIALLVKNGAKVNDPRKPPLHWAGKPEAAQALLDADADVNLPNLKGQTVLHRPAGWWAPKGATIKLLIESNADVNAADDAGVTPLHVAVLYRDLDAVKQLTAAGAKLDRKDKEGNTPLSLAEAAGKDFVKVLADSGATEDGKTDLQRAAAAGDIERVKALLAEGADVNATGPRKMSSLHYASAAGHVEVVTVLIGAGAQVDVYNEEAMRPLHLAAGAEVAEKLIAAGSLVNDPVRDMRGATPLYTAMMDGRADVVRVLIKHKVNLNTTPSPLVWATFAGRREVVEVLLEAGVNPSSGGFGGAPLHVAASGAFADMSCPKYITPEVRLEIVKLLIDKGADVNGSVSQGYLVDYRPLAAAAGRGDVAIMKLLLDKGAEIDAAPPRGTFAGYSALHAVAGGGHAEAVQLLLEREAAVNPTTGEKNSKGGKTPLDLAKDERVRQLLVKYGGKPASELTSDQ